MEVWVEHARTQDKRKFWRKVNRPAPAAVASPRWPDATEEDNPDLWRWGGGVESPHLRMGPATAVEANVELRNSQEVGRKHSRTLLEGRRRSSSGPPLPRDR